MLMGSSLMGASVMGSGGVPSVAEEQWTIPHTSKGPSFLYNHIQDLTSSSKAPDLTSSSRHSSIKDT